jgi:hypothetical protein
MKQSDHFRENADNCQRLAERAPDHPSYSATSAWKTPGARWPMNKTGSTAKPLRKRSRWFERRKGGLR